MAQGMVQSATDDRQYILSALTNGNSSSVRMLVALPEGRAKSATFPMDLAIYRERFGFTQIVLCDRRQYISAPPSTLMACPVMPRASSPISIMTTCATLSEGEG